MRKANLGILTLLSVSLFAALTLSQSGGTFVIEKSVIAGGGGNATGGIFVLDGTIGQPFGGTLSTGGTFSVASGFWSAEPNASGTPTPTPAISGTVTYGNAIGNPPPPRFVSNVLISGSGSVPVSIFTGGLGATEGQYSLSGFGSGAYTLTPTKTGGVSGLSSFDAARVSQHAVGPPLPVLTGNQLLVADVSNNGAITSFDAAMIAKFAAGPPFAPPGVGITGTWKFIPVSKNYASVTASIAGEDYSALLMGEVTGNWVNTGAARPVVSGSGPERSTTVMAPRMVSPADSAVNIQVAVQGASNKGIISYEFDLRYDSSVIQPQNNPVDLAGSVSSRLSAVANGSEAGRLRVVVYGPLPIDGNGVLLNLRFNAVGAPGSVSPLAWENLIFNEGDPRTIATNGQVMISAASPSEGEISGRLLTALGAGVPNARVTLTDSSGQTQSTLSNGFGVYRFGNLQTGQTYTISVRSRRYAFTPLTVSVTGQLASVDMIAEP